MPESAPLECVSCDQSFPKSDLVCPACGLPAYLSYEDEDEAAQAEKDYLNDHLKD